jgi:septum formation protein
MPERSNPLIYLASASPRRRALLAQIGVEHQVRAVEVDERVVPGEAPAQYVTRLAVAKAQTLWTQLDRTEGVAVLGSDTSVAIGNEILGKPRDQAHGREMLQQLSGRTHQVYTAVALRVDAGCESRLSISDVTMRTLSVDEMDAYWLTGEPVDKAGGYGIQGAAALFIERISGSYSGIVGLPLYETGELLKTIDWRMADRRVLGEAGAPG